MKQQLVFAMFFSLFSFSACDKKEFKETKITPIKNEMAQEAQVPVENKNELPPGHPPIQAEKAGPAQVMVEKMDKAKNGYTIEECFLKKNQLKNTVVTVRGKIVKYNAGIMGKNWIHLKDGSGSEGKNDLVITTSKDAKLNDVVTITGTLSTDKDIGSGYFFPIIIENAKLIVE